jgi:hypothetical protein
MILIGSKLKGNCDSSKMNKRLIDSATLPVKQEKTKYEIYRQGDFLT